MTEAAEAEAENKEESKEEQSTPPGALLDYGSEGGEEAAKEESKDAKEEGAAEEEGKETPLLAGKYKSVAELEKGYENLQKLASTRHSPEQYDISKDVKDFVGENTEMLDSFKKVAKSVDLSQDGFNKIVKWRMDEIQAMVDKQHKDAEATIKQLGHDADRRIRAVNAYLTTNLTKSQYTSLKAKINTAEDVTAIEKLIEKATSAVPSGPSKPTAPSTISSMENQLDRLIDKRRKEKGMPDAELEEKIRALSKKIAKARGA